MAYVYRAESWIDAPPHAVWDVLADLDAYPDWNPFTVEMRSDFQVGAAMDMRVRLGWITIWQREWIRALDDGRRVVWCVDEGPMHQLGLLSARRVQTLDAIDGGTRYVTVDTVEGLFSPLAHALFGGPVQRGFDGVAAALKARVEGR